MYARERELLRAHKDAWVRPLDQLLFPNGSVHWLAPVRTAAELAGSVFGIRGRRNIVANFVRLLAADRWSFRRGFAEKLRANAELFLRAAGELVRATPLRSLTLSFDSSGTFKSLAECPDVASLRSLRLYGQQQQVEDFDEFANSANLKAVRCLGLYQFCASGDDLRRMSESSLLTQLEELELGITIAGSDGVLALLAAAPTQSLVRLTLNRVWNESDTHRVIAAWPRCERLTDLNLSGNPLEGANLEPMLDRLPALTHLTLSHSGLDDAALRSLMRSERLRQLRWLDLSGTSITDQSVIHLVDSPWFLAPTRLDLRDTPLHEGIRRVVKARLGDRVLL
jgi:hypothetical protein